MLAPYAFIEYQHDDYVDKAKKNIDKEKFHLGHYF
jgi:hypothetical protein